MLLKLEEGTCIRFPVITNISEDTRLLDHAFCESFQHLEQMCIEHLPKPALAGAGDSEIVGPQGVQSVQDVQTEAGNFDGVP